MCPRSFKSFLGFSKRPSLDSLEWREAAMEDNSQILPHLKSTRRARCRGLMRLAWRHGSAWHGMPDRPIDPLPRRRDLTARGATKLMDAVGGTLCFRSMRKCSFISTGGSPQLKKDGTALFLLSFSDLIFRSKHSLVLFLAPAAVSFCFPRLLSPGSIIVSWFLSHGETSRELLVQCHDPD